MKLICTWPDGSKREVIQGQDTKSGLARVAWNESHAPMGQLGCVCGIEDEVPKEWLSAVTDEEAAEIISEYWQPGAGEESDPADWWKQ